MITLTSLKKGIIYAISLSTYCYIFFFLPQGLKFPDTANTLYSWMMT